MRLKRKPKKDNGDQITKSSAKDFTVTEYTTARGLRSMRKLSKARSYKLFADQYEALEQLRDEFGVDFNISDVIRDGVDLATENIRKKLENM